MYVFNFTEFPAVLFNLKTGETEEVFHKFLKPIEKPVLSNYCLNLTGISQKTVDNGILLQDALNQFHDWLSKNLKARQLMLPKQSKTDKTGNCAFVTYSDSDFEYFLHNECARKGIKKPPYFNQWIDIRDIFRNYYNRKALSLQDALQFVGLKFQGCEHSGLDDAKNTARLAKQLVQKGAPLKITKDLMPYQWNENCF